MLKVIAVIFAIKSFFRQPTTIRFGINIEAYCCRRKTALDLGFAVLRKMINGLGFSPISQVKN